MNSHCRQTSGLGPAFVNLSRHIKISWHTKFHIHIHKYSCREHSRVSSQISKAKCGISMVPEVSWV